MTNGSAAVVGSILTVALIVLLLGVVVRARRDQHTPTDFYLAGRTVGVGQNALALFAVFILLSSMFTMVGHVALNGFDAFLFASAFAVSWLVAMFFMAAPLRNVGGTTIADLFAVRAGERPARIASLLVSLLLYVTYTIVMFNAIGIVCRVAFGMESTTGQALVVAGAGISAMVFVLIGGMKGLTRLLVLKAVAVIAVLGLMTLAVLVKYRLNPFQMLADARANALPAPGGFDLLGPGRQYGSSGSDHLVNLSKLFAVVAGQAGLPYIFMRYFTATSGRDARRSAGWAGMLFVPFYLCTAIVGFAAVALLGGQNIGPIPPLRDLTLPRLGEQLAGGWLAGVLGVLGLFIVTGVLAALLMSAVTSLTRDVRVLRHEPLDTTEELQAARRNTVVVGIVGVILGVLLLPIATHALIPITVDLGGVIVPAVVYSLFWQRFNTRGLQWTIFGGVGATLALTLVSGLMSGTPVALMPNVDFHLIDIDPALVGVPVTFLLGYLGTIGSRERNDAAFAELQVRAFTGAEVPAQRDRRRRATPEPAVAVTTSRPVANGRRSRTASEASSRTAGAASSQASSRTTSRASSRAH
jgi:cation/acetate symporter